MQGPLDFIPSFRAAAAQEPDVRQAFEAWDAFHGGIDALRHDYDAAMLRYERRDAPDPAALRARMKGLQADCDQLFFKLLRAAESRMRERYI